MYRDSIELCKNCDIIASFVIFGAVIEWKQASKQEGTVVFAEIEGIVDLFVIIALGFGSWIAWLWILLCVGQGRDKDGE